MKHITLSLNLMITKSYVELCRILQKKIWSLIYRAKAS